MAEPSSHHMMLSHPFLDPSLVVHGVHPRPKQPRVSLTVRRSSSHITSMALSRKKATTIALDPEADRLLSRAARERGVSRSEFIRQHLALVLGAVPPTSQPKSGGIVRALAERGDERELFGGGR